MIWAVRYTATSIPAEGWTTADAAQIAFERMADAAADLLPNGDPAVSMTAATGEVEFEFNVEAPDWPTAMSLGVKLIEGVIRAARIEGGAFPADRGTVDAVLVPA